MRHPNVVSGSSRAVFVFTASRTMMFATMLVLGVGLVSAQPSSTASAQPPSTASTQSSPNKPAQPPAVPAAATSDKADELSEAVRKGDVARAKALLDEGVDVNTKYRYNRTALSFAADRGNPAMAQLLLERGADATIKDTFYGIDALMIAVSPPRDRTPGHTDVVRLLLQRGKFSPEALSDALEDATQAKLPDVVALLEAAGAKRKVK
jgi:ankyrin repeat protein